MAQLYTNCLMKNNIIFEYPYFLRTHFESASLKFQKKLAISLMPFKMQLLINEMTRSDEFAIIVYLGFLYKLMVFDPFLKSQMPIDFEFYSDTLFHSINLNSNHIWTVIFQTR